MPKVRKTRARVWATILSRPNAINHTAIYETMMESRAWQAIPVKARYLYFEMRRAYGGVPENEYNLMFTYQQAERLTKMSSPTITKMIKHLVDKGFITVEVEGRHKSIANRYAFSDGWKFWGSSPQERESLRVDENLEIVRTGRNVKPNGL